MAGSSSASAKVVVSAATVSRTDQGLSDPSFRSTWKPVSLSAPSVHSSSIVLEPVTVATSSEGAPGGTSSVVADASSVQGVQPTSLQARMR